MNNKPVFNYEIYKSLVEVDEVKERKGYDRAFLPVLGHVIKKHNWENNIIASLAHRHFELRPGEKMVADYNVLRREWTSRPLIINEDKLIPWNWKLGYDSFISKWVWYPLDFLHDIPKFKKEKAIVKTLLDDNLFLEDLAITVAKEGVADVFGMALLMSRFNDFTSDLVMFEKNDRENRISTSFFIPKHSLDNPEAVTQWHFRGDILYKDGPGPLRWCDHM